MALVDKAKVLELISDQNKALNTEFDQPETSNDRKHEINGALALTFWMRQEVTKLPDQVAKKDPE